MAYELKYDNFDEGNKTCSIVGISVDWTEESVSISLPSEHKKDSVIYTVTSIGDRLAIVNRKSLTSIEIPNSVTSIGEYAFSNCKSLTRVILGNSVTSIGSGAFKDCNSLINVFMGNNVTSIDYEAFFNCTSLTSIIIPDSVTSIIGFAFTNCKSLKSVVIPDGVTSIGNYTFYGCDNLTSVTIGNGVTSIGWHAFSRCTSLTSVVIPDSVTSIGSSAFRYCTSLTSVVIGDSVTSIGEYAFSDCGDLTQLVLFPSKPPKLDLSAIPLSLSDKSIYVQQSSKEAYKTDWASFKGKIVSDNLYLSFVRFNQKNKEYIDEKINNIGTYTNLGYLVIGNNVLPFSIANFRYIWINLTSGDGPVRVTGSYWFPSIYLCKNGYPLDLTDSYGKRVTLEFISDTEVNCSNRDCVATIIGIK